jgi:hypothetical protein
VVLAGCGGEDAVAIDAPDLPARDAAVCRSFVDALPDTVYDKPARDVTPADAPGAAWGDPPIVLTCGVGRPADFTDSSTCIQANGVGWYVPDDVLLNDDETLDVTMTAVGYRPRVQVVVPGDYRPEGFAAAATTIGAVVDRVLTRVRRCT